MSDVIIVGGGDGFMLSSLKKYIKFRKPFYGINCGTYGFLMSENTSLNLYKIKMAKKPLSSPWRIWFEKIKGTLASMKFLYFVKANNCCGSIKLEKLL